jgi:uncharacterized membrane protein YfcA
MTLLLGSLVIFIAAFTQSLTGFGFALVSMPLLVSMIGLQAAAPLVALAGLAAEAALLFRYRLSVDRLIVRRLLLPSFAGIPIGIFALHRAGEDMLLRLLGFILLGYALYAFWNPQMPAPKGAGWAYGAGFLAGVLGGAYNTSGPPVIVYGDSQRWDRPEFKGNLQGFFLLNSLVVVAGHWLADGYTGTIWRDFLLVVPAGILGLAAGLWLDTRLNADRFRKIVLALLAVLGVRFLMGM